MGKYIQQQPETLLVAAGTKPSIQQIKYVVISRYKIEFLEQLHFAVVTKI
jgi:hypothetical protein